MTTRLKSIVEAIRSRFSSIPKARTASQSDIGDATSSNSAADADSHDEYQREYPPEFQIKSPRLPRISKAMLRNFVVLSGLAAATYAVYQHPPIQTIGRGQVGVRSNLFTGNAAQFREGSVIVIPGIYQLRKYSLQDQLYRPTKANVDHDAPFQ